MSQCGLPCDFEVGGGTHSARDTGPISLFFSASLSPGPTLMLKSGREENYVLGPINHTRCLQVLAPSSLQSAILQLIHNPPWGTQGIEN